MMTLAQQIRIWRSRHRLSKTEAALALGLTVGGLEKLEQGQDLPRGRERDALLGKLSRDPKDSVRGNVPDAGRRSWEA